MSNIYDVGYFKTIQIHDKLKNKYCIENGIKLIRIENLKDIEPRLNKEFNINKEMII
jgi:hypothetical protein